MVSYLEEALVAMLGVLALAKHKVPEGIITQNLDAAIHYLADTLMLLDEKRRMEKIIAEDRNEDSNID